VADDRLLRQYLLGELADAERERLQERYFIDAELYARLLAAEDDLIDEYVRGELTDDERRRFEERFRSPEQRQRVEFARKLRRAAEDR
jgi:anti-sigma factor RsiW